MQHTELFLIRHGETLWNRNRRIQGQLDIGLSEFGARQARAVAERLRDVRFRALYSSDLTRAHATARPIAAATGLDIRLEAALRERHFGILQGTLRSVVQAHYTEIWEAYRNDPDYQVPAGESSRGFNARCVNCLETLAQRHPGERIAIVTHGGVLGSLLRHTLNMPPTNHRPFSVYNAGINIFYYQADTRTWRLDTWGDAAHLHDMT